MVYGPYIRVVPPSAMEWIQKVSVLSLVLSFNSGLIDPLKESSTKALLVPTKFAESTIMAFLDVCDSVD